DLSGVLRARGRRPDRPDGAARLRLGGGPHGGGLHGRPHLHRQCPEPHDLCDRGRARRQDAELLRLYGLVLRGAAAGLRAHHLLVRGAGLTFLAPAARLARGGKTATASISSKAPSRAKPPTASVVLAGSAPALRWRARTSR